MTSTIAWLDHDESQKRAMQKIIDSFGEKGAIDELGLGVLRDTIQGALHPTTSTLHTRPRYLVFVAWVFRDARGRTAQQALANARKGEHITREALMHHYASSPQRNGIIGINAGRELKRMPSDVYWGQLANLGIRKYAGTTEAWLSKASRPALTITHAPDDDPQLMSTGWDALPVPPSDWREDLAFDIPAEESQYLQDRLAAFAATRPTSSEPLICWLARHPVPATSHRFVWEHELADKFPSETKRIMGLGRDLDLVLHGARILYNLLCAKSSRRPELEDRYREMLTYWQDELSAADMPSQWRNDDFWAWMQTAHPRPTTATRLFVERWVDIIGQSSDVADDPGAATLVRSRERNVKGALARIDNPARLARWEGDSGLGRFDFNWAAAQTLLNDLNASAVGGA